MVQTRSQSIDGGDSDVLGHPPNTSDSNGENAQHRPPIAKARINYKATNCLELSFNAGDEITELKEVGPNILEGYNTATRKKGMFNREHVLCGRADRPQSGRRRVIKGDWRCPKGDRPIHTALNVDGKLVRRFLPTRLFRYNQAADLELLLDTKEGKQPVKKSPVRPQPAVPRQFVTKAKPEHIPSNENVVLQFIPKNLRAIFVFATVIAFAIAIALWQANGQKVKSWKIRVNMTDLKTQFSSQEPDLWDSLKAGLMSSRTEGVQTFVFLHNSPRTAVCFIKKLSDNNCVAYRASDISNSESFVSEVKMKLLAHKCLIMYDLEDLHPEGVAVLKGFCDAYEPIVPDTQFFFALNAGPELDIEAKKLARNLLESKWSKDFTHDDFGGTLTRLTQNVLKIRNEPNVPC